MVLNWSPIVIADFFTATVFFVFALLTKVAPRVNKIKSLFFFRLYLISFGFHMFLFALSNLYLDIFLDQLSLICYFPTAIFLVIGINYLMKEAVLSYTLLFVFGGGIILSILAFQPGLIQFQMQSGFLEVNELDLLSVFYDFMTLIIGGYLVFWGLKTRLNAPLLIKREANLFLLGILVGGLSIPAYILIPTGPYNIILGDIVIAIGVAIFTIAFIREPKLLYIFPFTLHRILVKDRNGYALFDHDWSESGISEPVFTGFINAVQLMSEEVMNLGGVLFIDLQDGIFILNKSENITVGLVTTKSSKLLKDSIMRFTNDFEEKFQRQLKKSIIDRREYTAAYELIEKYFSNFPSKLIRNRKEPLLLVTKYRELPIALDNELRCIINDDKKYEAIKEELKNSPYGMSSTFFDLYEELKNKPDQITNEEDK